MKAYLIQSPCLLQFKPERPKGTVLKQDSQRIKETYNHKFKWQRQH